MSNQAGNLADDGFMEREVAVAIVGVGLIGGSLAMALRGRPGVREVVGIDRDGDALATALGMGAIDRMSTCLEAVADCQVVVVAVPVQSIVPVIRDLLPFCSPGTVITDVGSTKSQICQAVTGLLPEGIAFVGGHPMAGAERRGIGAADRYLFQNAAYVLTPLPGVDEKAVRLVKALVRAAGARPIVLSPHEHDKAVAVTSHLPHVVAAALVDTLMDVGGMLPPALELAAGGFRDTTRIASGDPIIWRDICLSNREAILQMLERFQTALDRFRDLVRQADGPGLQEAFAASKQARDRLPSRAKGILGQVFDLVVHVIDRPGTIAEVSALLAREGINIIDIEILRVREGEGGTLRLAFETLPVMEKAFSLLQGAGYQVRARQ